MILFAALSLLPTIWTLGLSTSDANFRAIASPIPLVAPTHTMVGDDGSRALKLEKAA